MQQNATLHADPRDLSLLPFGVGFARSLEMLSMDNRLIGKEGTTIV